MKPKNQCSGVLTIILAACVFLILFCACPDSPTTASLELHLDPMARTILPEGTPLFVTTYAVEGTGPEGQTFTVNSASSLVSVEGLTVGAWSLRATGRNNQGLILVSGRSDVTLQKDRNVISMVLDTMVGTGTLSVGISWDAGHIDHAGIRLVLVDETGQETELTPTAFNEMDGTALLSVQVPAGSYSLCIQLTESGAVKAGHVTAVRVVDGLVSEGMVHLALDEPTRPPYSFLLENKTGVPVTCHIVGADKDTLPEGPVTARLEVEDGLSTEDLGITWFLNGKVLGEGESVTFTPPKGYNRLDVIARGPQSGTMGSTGWQFKLTQGPATPGVPSLTRLYADRENDIRILGTGRLAFLGDGSFALSSTGSSTLQLCKIIREEIHVLRTYDASSGWPVQSITDMFADQESGRVLTASSSSACVGLYQYDSAYGSLTKKFIAHGADASPPFTRTGRLGRYAHYEESPHIYVLMLNPDGHTTPLYDLSGESQKKFSPGVITWNGYSDGIAYPYLSVISPGKQSILVMSRQEQKIWIAQRKPGSSGYGDFTSFGAGSSDGGPLADVSSGIFISDSCALVAHGSFIEQYDATGLSSWAHTRTLQAGSDGLSAFTGITDMAVNSLGTLLFLSTDGGPVLSFAIEGSSISYLGSSTAPEGSFIPERIYPSPDGQWLLATGMEGGLAMYEVPHL